jgi:hypothetical protein
MSQEKSIYLFGLQIRDALLQFQYAIVQVVRRQSSAVIPPCRLNREADRVLDAINFGG